MPHVSRSVRLLLACLLALACAGCLRYRADLSVGSGDTVSGTLVVGFKLGGADLPSGLTQTFDVPAGLKDKVAVKPYSQDGYTGSEVTIDELTLAEVSTLFSGDQGSGATVKLDLKRDGDVLAVSGELYFPDLLTGAGGGVVPSFPSIPGVPSLPGLPSAGSPLPSVPGVPSAADFDARIAIAFPGMKVVDTNGQVSGDTIAWTPKLGEKLQLAARVSGRSGAAGSSGAGLPGWVVPVVVAGVVLLLALGLIGYGRSRMRRDAAVPAYAGAPPAYDTGQAPAYQQQPPAYQPGHQPPAYQQQPPTYRPTTPYQSTPYQPPAYQPPPPPSYGPPQQPPSYGGGPAVRPGPGLSPESTQRLPAQPGGRQDRDPTTPWEPPSWDPAGWGREDEDGR